LILPLHNSAAIEYGAKSFMDWNFTIFMIPYHEEGVKVWENEDFEVIISHTK
jgi:hypothetical protein